MNKYELKIGDYVIVTDFMKYKDDRISYGRIFNIKYKNGIVEFYSIREHNYEYSHGWSYNFFPRNLCKIELDIEKMRDDKINLILNRKN